MCSSIEVWKPVVGWEGLYEISNKGRLRGVDRYVVLKTYFKKFQVGVINKGQISKVGYVRYLLRDGSAKKLMSAHRLVAMAFIENPLLKTQINHKNGIKTDNCVCNLEWCTPKENVIHAHSSGLCKSRKGIYGNGLHYILALDSNLKVVHRFLGYAEARRFLNLKDSASVCIYRACLDFTKTAYGFHWCYEDDYF